MIRRLTAGLGAAVLLIALAAGISGIAEVAVAPAATAQTVATTVLSQDILPGLPLLTASPVSPTRVLHIGIGLESPHAAAASAYASALYDSTSPTYHHFLTPSQYDALYGVPTSTLHSVQSFLIDGGLTVTETASSGNWIQATGTIANIDKLFQVTISQYSSKGVSFLANKEGPTVPAGRSIVAVVGLNTLQRFSTVPKKSGQPAAQSVPSSPGCLPSCDYTPQDLWSLYHQPSTDKGQGETMAVFGEGRSDDVISNLRAFEKNMKLPEIPVTVKHVGAGPFTDDSGQIEWDLDTQASTGMAPEVMGETLYFASSLSDADVESAFSSWVSDPHGPQAANASFGECESDPANTLWNAEPPAIGQFAGDGDNLEPVAESTLQQATIEGRTLFASAGDTGSSCPFAALPVIGAGNGVLNQAQPLLNYPCASDHAVCVGGTVLYSNGAAKNPQRSVEYAWPYTGGGSSGFLAEPRWQKGVAAIDHPCLVNPSGNPYPAGTICRGAPDVAAMSGDIATNGYDIYYNGAASTEGGTSLSSPLWVGMWTRVQSAARKGGLGFADPTFYKIGSGKLGNYAKDFFDVTEGTNGLYQAGTGWDYVSGWGVPNVANLMKSLDGKLTPTNPTGPGPVGGGTKLACGLLWQNPPHTSTDALANSDPQLSLLTGAMSLSKDRKSVLVKLEVTNLSATVPTGASAEDWYMTWTFKGTTYFGQAELGALPGSVPTFSDGTVVATGSSHQYQAANTDTGAFKPGAHGIIEIAVPLAHVGKPGIGSVLGQPTGATYTEEGVPPNPSGVSGGSLEAVDSGGPTRNYTVGSTCPA
ncbi:MAG: S53 family peptidase [Acidimicrobiales bacterium]